MPSTLVDSVSSFLARRTDRRGFLHKTAVVGSALAVTPSQYVLRPGTAYAAVCSCSGRTCSCGSRCCDGYTEFCCTKNGVNRCPAGSIMAGWWKVDGSGFCGGRPRYYMDCNAPCGGCGCGSSGLCAGSCSGTPCGCAGANCNNRKTGCTRFRYGQCNQGTRCVGPIICRVISCQPPWTFDRTCTTAPATDNATRSHDAACLHRVNVGRVNVGVALWRQPNFYFRRTQRGGPPSYVMAYGGKRGDKPLLGDWNGDGVKTPGIRRGTAFYLTNSLSPGHPYAAFHWGRASDVPLVGDWNGNGVDSLGLRHGSTWFLKNPHDTSPHTIAFNWGRATDVPLVGKWNGPGRSGIGLRRGSTWYLKNSYDSGPHTIQFDWGRATDIPIVGDWNGDGRDGIGLVRGGVWYIKNRLDSSPHYRAFRWGRPTDKPFGWQWGRE